MRLANRILERLYDRQGRCVPLDELAAAGGANVNRGRMERALEEVRARGHVLERSPLGGVRLVRPTVLDAHLIERDLPVRRIGRHVICFAAVGSTNNVAFDSARSAGARPLVVTAEFQRAGRGRLGRRWLSRPGEAILASVLLGYARRGPGRGGLAPEGLTIAAGLAVAEGIEQATGVRAMLEWPNDVVFEGAKLAGVMVEVREVPAGGRLVVGFGINVAGAPAPGEVARAVTCLTEAAGTAPERIEVLRAVLVALDGRVADVRARRIAALHDAWARRCAMLNRRVTVASAGRRVTGRVLDVSPREGLFLLTDAGERLHLAAATSTVVH
jgi:BirA family biotin operon repressor/biotin-[acetyl-CoA-carboxylase] ligase